jgi:S1-C subfamily serine protease
MQAHFCGNYDADPTTYNGKMRMTVEWQIYDVLKREVIARIDTTAGGEERRRSVDGRGQVMLAAFRENVRALAADETFRRLITSSSTAVSSPTPSPIALRTIAADKRPISSAADAVVAVFTGAGHGSGFLISPDGYLITNQHVVGDATQVRVRWSDKSESVGEVLRVDRRRDIALVKVDAGARKPLALRRAATDLGQVVFAIGTPLDPKLQGTVTRGIVSANRVFEGQAFIQSDVIINGGNSGGPLLDEAGNVIGVAVSGYEISGAPVGINLFIPIDDALKVLALQPAS